MLPTDAGLRLIHLTKQARRAVELLSEAIQHAEPDPPTTCNRITGPTADEACALLDSLPTIPGARKRKTITAREESGTVARVLAVLRTKHPAWLTAAAIRESTGDAGHDATRRICKVLARLATRGTITRREVSARSFDRYEYRIVTP